MSCTSNLDLVSICFVSQWLFIFYTVSHVLTSEGPKQCYSNKPIKQFYTDKPLKRCLWHLGKQGLIKETFDYFMGHKVLSGASFLYLQLNKI